MRHVSYAANANGYIIRVYEDDQVIAEYASNVPNVLAVIYSDRKKVLAFTKTTALVVAKDYHVIAKHVKYDEKLESLILQESSLASITVLSDGATFTATNGCEVVEYNESVSEFEDAGTANEIVPLVLNGKIKGHVYSVPALVNLYKALLECPKPLPDGIMGKLAVVEQA
jgi:hypothetical protein